MKKYSKYKLSEIEWIGKIPEHWINSRLKYDVRLTMGQSPESENYNEDGFGLPFLQGNTEFGKEFPTNTKWTTQVTKRSNIDDLLFSVRGSLGEMNWSDKEYCIGRGLCSITPIELERKFCFYLLHTLMEEIKSIGVGSTFLSITTEDIKNLIYYRPDKKEQQLIIKFLDEKTELINKLISTKEKKIELLKLQRTSLIDETITKGLDRKVKKKDSGVEWIGEIPEHWGLKPLKYLIKNLNSGVSVNSENIPVENPEEVGILKTSCVYGDNFKPEENKKVLLDEYERVSCPVKRNSIIISRMNTPELVGSSGYVENEFPNLYLPDRLWITEFVNETTICVKFYSYVLKSDRYKKTLSSKSTGTSSSMKNISKDDLLSLLVPFFDIKEQVQIVEFLDFRIQEIDNLISLELKKIELLIEYRQSLISSVITGKIDVRTNPN